MLRAALATAVASLATVGVPPPPAPGPWRQLGAVVTSKAGKQVHFFRVASPGPKALAVVVASTSARPIRLFWFSDCEQEMGDGMSAQQQQTVTGKRVVVAYPPVADGATQCYVTVNASAGQGAVVRAAVFAQ